ncbi:hypothetical protein HY991_05795 [Candidatus Micrarchaeota archaeon]|nr:hypothetical protein [Candidatus Micrarchaeota archaeon]
MMLLITSLSGAANITIVAKAYAYSNETVSIESFPADSGNLSMIKMNEVETIILKPAGDDFTAIIDETAIKSAVNAYVSNKISSLLGSTAVNSLSRIYGDLNKTLAPCRKGIAGFFKFCGLGTVCFYIEHKTQFSGISAVTVQQLFDLKQQLNTSFIEMDSSLVLLEKGLQLLNDASSAKDVQGIQAASGSVYSGLQKLRTNYEKIYSSYVGIVSYFPYSFGLGGCPPYSLVNGNATAMMNVIGQSSQLDSAGMMARIVNESGRRATYALNKKALIERESQFVTITNKTIPLQRQFSDVRGVDLVGLTLKVSQLNLSLKSLHEAKTEKDVKDAIAKFDEQYNSTQQTVAAVSSLLPEYRAVEASRKNASEAIATAYKRFGSDSRVVSLRDEFFALKLKLEEEEKNIVAGKTVEPTALTPIKEKFNQLAVKAASLGEKAQEFDVVVVAAILVIVVVVVIIILFKIPGKPSASSEEERSTPLQYSQIPPT